MSFEKMKILIVGATGGVGICLIRELLAEIPLASIVILARKPSKIPKDISHHSSVTIIRGELSDLDQLDTAMTKITIVISCLGPSVAQAASHPSGCPIAGTYRDILTAMQDNGVTRLIALGTSSMRDPRDTFSKRYCFLGTGFAVLAHTAYQDVVAIGNAIREAGDDWKELEWTIARVPMLDIDDGGDRKYLAGYVGGQGITTRLSRRAYAAFVVDEIERKQWVKKAPLVCSPH